MKDEDGKAKDEGGRRKDEDGAVQPSRLQLEAALS